MPEPVETPAAALMRLTNGYQVSQAIHVAAELRLADFVGAEPVAAEEIAPRVGTHPRSLYRLLRALKSRVFYQRLFAMTPTLETDEVVLLTTPARRGQLALERKPGVTVDADTWNHRGVHFGFVVREEVLSHSGDAIRQAGGEVVVEGSRAMGLTPGRRSSSSRPSSATRRETDEARSQWAVEHRAGADPLARVHSPWLLTANVGRHDLQSSASGVTIISPMGADAGGLA